MIIENTKDCLVLPFTNFYDEQRLMVVSGMSTVEIKKNLFFFLLKVE